MRTSELDFNLPNGRIATKPAEPRESARLMVLSRSDPGVLLHRRIADLPSLLAPGDRLVFNRSRVLPARFEGINLDTGGKVQGLWLRDAEPADTAAADTPPQDPTDAPTTEPTPARRWVVLLKARRFRAGRRVELTRDNRPTGVVLTLLGKLDEGESGEAGAWLVSVTVPHNADGSPPPDTAAVLDRAGLTPLPPYILGARRKTGETVADELDRAAYQTIFARHQTAAHAAPQPTANHHASVAAPTAGLHFTPALLETLERRGIDHAEVTLHVGAGTFKPIETEHVEDHPMHAEWCSLAEPRDRYFAPATGGGPSGRLIPVGSTSVRTLESFAAAQEQGEHPDWLSTDLLITPGYRWRVTRAMLTNFHLPRSTLIAMVAAMLEHEPGAGLPRLLDAYQAAIDEHYRFFSFGDAMLILP